MSTNDRNPELMFLGKECHHPACHLNDFLPFNCPACHLSYCQPHFLPSQHHCKSPLPSSMIDRIAPQCPLCNQVVPTTSSHDPNEAVDRHILDGICVGLPGGKEKRKAELKAKKVKGQVCWRKGCTKSLIVPMRCESCQHLFCPPHRSTQSHTCTPNTSRSNTPQPAVSAGPSRSAAGTNGAKAAMSRLLPTKTPTPQQPPQPRQPNPVPIAAYKAESAPLDVRAAAAAAAMKRAGQDAKANMPFVKTKMEKRANNEISSQIQALKNRHDKGLLSKTEEIRYAELLAENKGGKMGKMGGGKGKDGCTVC